MELTLPLILGKAFQILHLVTQKVSLIRDYLRGFQRHLAEAKSCVMEGRDIGTVIFPEAYLKIFLTATDTVRAERRQKQLELKGERVKLETLIDDIKKRDERDSERDLAPLVKANDAYEILTDKLDIEDVVREIITLEKPTTKDSIKNYG